MSALMSKFKGSAAGESLAEAGTLGAEGVETSLDTSAKNAQIKPEVIQAAVIQAAQPDSQPGKQPQKVAEAERQFQSLVSKPVSLGPALSVGDGVGKANARMTAAKGASEQFANKAAELQKVIATGGDQPKASAAASFGRAAAGPGAAPVAPVAAPAGPTAPSTSYNPAAVFNGQSGGVSSFKTTDSRGRDNGYVSAPEQPAAAAPVSTAFMSRLSSVPGDRNFGIAEINLASQGLNGFDRAPKLDATMPKLESTPAAKALLGINRNGFDVARAEGDKPEADKESLDFKPTKPGNPGVMVPRAALPALA